MSLLRSWRLVAAALTLGGSAGAAPAGAVKAAAAAVTFRDAAYLHRWAQADQHEFTPKGQEDLEHWSDMVTVDYYRRVTTGEQLAATANSVLGIYRSNHAIIVRTNSVPRTPEKPAEYLIVALFPQHDFIEAVFARFRLEGGIGLAVIYSHREYGQKIGNQMSAWLQQNGPADEQALMALAPIPILDPAP